MHFKSPRAGVANALFRGPKVSVPGFVGCSGLAHLSSVAFHCSPHLVFADVLIALNCFTL